MNKAVDLFKNVFLDLFSMGKGFIYCNGRVIIYCTLRCFDIRIFVY